MKDKAALYKRSNPHRDRRSPVANKYEATIQVPGGVRILPVHASSDADAVETANRLAAERGGRLTEVKFEDRRIEWS